MTARNTHLDPRIRRTRAYLREALIELVLEEGYQNLTIKDMTDRACLNRSTFYRHYQDKDDLLKTGFEEYWDEVLPGSQLFIYNKPALPHDRLLDALKSDLEHFEQLRDFYRITLIQREIPFFRESLSRHLLKITQGRFTPLLSLTAIPAVPLQLVHRWLASAYLGAILDWLEADQPGTPAELASQISKLFTYQLQGIFWPEVMPGEMIPRQGQIA